MEQLPAPRGDAGLSEIIATASDRKRPERGERMPVYAPLIRYRHDPRTLYFVANPATGLVKIGVTQALWPRIEGLENGCGVPLVLLAALDGCAGYEPFLHRAFAATRRLGEWFAPSPELVALLRDCTESRLYELLTEHPPLMGEAGLPTAPSPRLTREEE
jgi:hypothetical protein